MTLQAPIEGDGLLLQYMVAKTSNASPTIHLFSNNVNPNKYDKKSQSSYTICTAAGYTSIGLTGANWASAVSSGSTVSISYSTPVTFSMTAAQPVYGYYITDGANSTYLWSEAFGVVENIPSGGGSIILTPCISLN
jgi:hypothetical protein